jgi:hypothetical protein
MSVLSNLMQLHHVVKLTANGWPLQFELGKVQAKLNSGC